MTYLFHFFKLMDSKDAEHISSTGTSFFTEARRVARVFQWQLICWGLKPFVRMQGRDRLLRSSNEVFLLVLFRSRNLGYGYMHQFTVQTQRR